MILDKSKIKIERKYLSGIKYSNEAIRKFQYKLTIEGNLFFKDSFFSETLTKKVKGGEWGKGDTSFYFTNDSEMFDNIEDMIKSKYELK